MSDPYDTIELPDDAFTKLIVSQKGDSIIGTAYNNISFCQGIKVKHPRGAALASINGRLFVNDVEFKKYPCVINPKVQEWRQPK